MSLSVSWTNDVLPKSVNPLNPCDENYIGADGPLHIFLSSEFQNFVPTHSFLAF